MDTKQYLGQIKKFEKMIINKTSEIEQLRTLAYGTSVQSDNDYIRNTSNGDKVGTMATKIAETESEIKEMVKKRTDIVKQIESIGDFALYDVLAKRYILDMSNKEIAFELKSSERKVGRLFFKAHEEFERKHGKEYLYKMS